MARLEGVEPPARGFEGRCSIQLSYRRAAGPVAQGPGERKPAGDRLDGDGGTI